MVEAPYFSMIMCTQIQIILLCPCPLRDTPLCPHHVHLLPVPHHPNNNNSNNLPHSHDPVTANLPANETPITHYPLNHPAEYAPSGFRLRLPTVLQSHISWSPPCTSKEWEHCAVYKLRHRTGITSTSTKLNGTTTTTNTTTTTTTLNHTSHGAKKQSGQVQKGSIIKTGRESCCPVTKANRGRLEAGWTKVVRRLCLDCAGGHKDADADADVDAQGGSGGRELRKNGWDRKGDTSKVGLKGDLAESRETLAVVVEEENNKGKTVPSSQSRRAESSVGITSMIGRGRQGISIGGVSSRRGSSVAGGSRYSEACGVNKGVTVGTKASSVVGKPQVAGLRGDGSWITTTKGSCENSGRKSYGARGGGWGESSGRRIGLERVSSVISERMGTGRGWGVTRSAVQERGKGKFLGRGGGKACFAKKLE